MDKMTIQLNPPRYYLGCPLWSNKDWVGRFFSRMAKPREFMAQYASVLSSVEGNTTFYAIPRITTVRKWRQAAPLPAPPLDRDEPREEQLSLF